MNTTQPRPTAPAARRSRPAPRSPRPAAAAPQAVRPLAPVREEPSEIATPAMIVEGSAQAEVPAPLPPPSRVEFENLASTNMFETLGGLRALVPVRALASSELPEFTTQEIYAVAEIGYHYLRAGGYRLAAVLFEGLTAIRPTEPYFANALGLAVDMLGDSKKAAHWYSRAREIDPTDGRADVNLAELCLATGDRARALTLLRSGAKKAAAKKDHALEQKANAILSLAGAKV